MSPGGVTSPLPGLALVGTGPQVDCGAAVDGGSEVAVVVGAALAKGLLWVPPLEQAGSQPTASTASATGSDLMGRPYGASGSPRPPPRFTPGKSAEAHATATVSSGRGRPRA